jgi:VWFA-related protein
MTFNRFVRILLTWLFPALPGAFAQLPLPAISPPGASSTALGIQIGVVVNTKSGQPVTNLRQQDFTILDNKSPRPIKTFRVVSGAQEPVEVIVMIDDVNTPYDSVAYVRKATEKFLESNGGSLAHPISIGVFADSGLKIDNLFSTDGKSLSRDLEHRVIGLRQITTSTDWGDQQRLAISLRALHQLVTFAAPLPGRKIILWISPGWPLLSGPTVYLLPPQHQQIFGDVVYFSSQLRHSNIVLYNINPLGLAESTFDANYYNTFVKGVAKAGDAQFASVSLQVLSVQSGGLTIEAETDVAAMIQKCLADADSWYEITFDPLPADKPNEYHHIEVKLDQPGLIVRTRDGYYANPIAVDPAH